MIKNLLGQLLSMSIVICATCGVLRAQDRPQYPTPCSPCKIALRHWNQVAVTMKIVTVGTCTFKVYFKKRTCNSDGCQELRLEKVTPYVPNPCSTVEPSELATLILGTMVQENTMGFKPDSISEGMNGCWRITRPSCWTIRLPDERCETWPRDTTSEMIDSARTPYHPGDLVPCDTSQCCTNVIYPTKDQCGDIVYTTPSAADYPFLHMLRNAPGDSTDSAHFEDARAKFFRQFTDTTCVTCTAGTVDAGAPKGPSGCNNHCKEDMMLEYKRLVNLRLKRLYDN
ncbi:MAG: hypothetical protein JSS89_06000 [Bacteroidetes bacterium]|nr:hypothetical protein [Bacteroidota bacterium]